MKLGIDFGTTRIVVAAADRGNFPLVNFECPDGQTRDWFPPLAAIGPGGMLFGFDTWRVQATEEWTVIRSLKRLLKDAAQQTVIETGTGSAPLGDLLNGMLTKLARHLRDASTLRPRTGEPLEAIIGVPANANSTQRFLTAEAFRAAGFSVSGIVNEPSAAGLEFAHREAAADRSTRSILVYDLGGGTFDASIVELQNGGHQVTANDGIQDLGGDDFDEILADLALESAALAPGTRESLTMAELYRLLEECRERKEALNPNTRKIVLDLDKVREGWGEVAVPAAEFYERCRPLVRQTEDVVSRLLSRAVDTLYVTGGGSELPAVARVLKETFGRKVRRSAYMRSATAIGLAIAAERAASPGIRDRFAEHFGVWRETDSGRHAEFDVLFPRGLELPAPGAAPLRVRRGYHPAHNIGYFRFVECSALDRDGQPSGDLSLWDSILFPFDPALAGEADLAGTIVHRSDAASHQWIEEEYRCDPCGQLRVSISNCTSGYRREFALGRWSGETVPVHPVRIPGSARKTRAGLR